MQIVDRTTPEGGGGVHSHGNFLPQLPPHSPASFPSEMSSSLFADFRDVCEGFVNFVVFVA